LQLKLQTEYNALGRRLESDYLQESIGEGYILFIKHQPCSVYYQGFELKYTVSSRQLHYTMPPTNKDNGYGVSKAHGQICPD